MMSAAAQSAPAPSSDIRRTGAGAAHPQAQAAKAAKPRRHRTDAGKRQSRTGWAFMLPFAILFALVFIVPIIWAIYSSFFRQVSEGGGAYGGGELVNKFVGFENFKFAATSSAFWSGVGRVVLYTLIQVPIMIILALIFALLLDSQIMRHVGVYRLGYFLPYAIPGVVASIIWVYLYNGQISPIVKGLAAIGINVDFFGKNVVLASMANITTWTYTGYNMLIFSSPRSRPSCTTCTRRPPSTAPTASRSPGTSSCRPCAARPCSPCSCPSWALSSCSTSRRSWPPPTRRSPNRIRR